MRKGSITIYLSLVLTLVLGLICTITESGRVSVVSAKTAGITYMALDSSFSEYAVIFRRLWFIVFVEFKRRVRKFSCRIIPYQL
jgi:hypothetical protein